MKVNFNQNLKALDGKPLVDPQETARVLAEEQKKAVKAGLDFVGSGKKFYLKMKKVCIDALILPKVGDKTSPEEKVKRFKLAMRIEEGDTEITIEEAALLKDLVGEMFGPLIVGRVWEILENTEPPKETKK